MTVERAAHARSVIAAKGRPIGRLTVVDPDKFAYAIHLGESGYAIADVVAKTGTARTRAPAASSCHDRQSK